MKNFEKEYREMIQEEMPDLWERIEAGLVEKESVVNVKKEKKKGRIDRRVLKYSGLAAACLCGVIVLPAIVLTVLNVAVESTDMASAEMATTEMASTEMTAEKMETEEMATEEMEAAQMETEEIVAAGMATTEMEMADANADTGSNGMMEAPAEEVQEYALSERKSEEEALTDEVTEATTESEKGAALEAADAGMVPEDGAVLENLVVRIMEVKPLNYHTVYLAVVESDADGVFRAEEIVEFLAVDYEDTRLKEGEVYTVTLEYAAQSEIPLHLKHVYVP